jgi:uncharacterized DUF497 family protein
MDFEWDEAKRESNLEEHLIDFLDAITIGSEPVIDPANSRSSGGEDRYLALGTIGDDHLTIAVVYTVRGNVRRIISARRARRNERQVYKSIFGRGR